MFKMLLNYSKPNSLNEPTAVVLCLIQWAAGMTPIRKKEQGLRFQFI